MSTSLTPKSLALFLDFANDAGNWHGTPLVGGNVEMTKAKRGNLSDLVQKGLVIVSDDGEGQTWIHFTAAGVELAKENGVDLDWVETAAQAEGEEPVIENGLEMDPTEGEAFETPMEAEAAAADEPEAEEAPKPTKEKATPRDKLTLTDLDGKPVTSRRAPALDTLTLALDLVTQFGGGVATPVEKLHAAGFDADTLDRIRKRLKSWFGKDRVAQTKAGLVINLRVREAAEAEVEAAA